MCTVHAGLVLQMCALDTYVHACTHTRAPAHTGTHTETKTTYTHTTLTHKHVRMPQQIEKIQNRPRLYTCTSVTTHNSLHFASLGPPSEALFQVFPFFSSTTSLGSVQCYWSPASLCHLGSCGVNTSIGGAKKYLCRKLLHYTLYIYIIYYIFTFILGHEQYINSIFSLHPINDTCTVHVHVHTYTRPFPHIHKNTYTNTRPFPHIHTNTYTNTHPFPHIHKNTYTNTRPFPHIHKNTYTNTRPFPHIHTNTYTNTRPFPHIHTNTYTNTHKQTHSDMHIKCESYFW